jgi:hypothetical protein
MRLASFPAAVLLASGAFAGPIGGVDPHAAPATGFPGAYLGTVALSLSADPLYASRFLDSVDTHLRAVSVMTSPPEVADYLAQSATVAGDLKALRAALGRQPLDAPKTAALLIADALSRPEQFREVLDGLERLKPGLGRRSAELVRGAKVTGSLLLLQALRAAGARDPQTAPPVYAPDGPLTRLLDGASSVGPDGIVLGDPPSADAPTDPASSPDGRSRRSGPSLSPRP